jgi:amino acid adenylation domain-containing protein
MIELIKRSLRAFPDRNAIWVKNRYYTYYELGRKVSAIRALLKSKEIPKNQNVGVVAYPPDRFAYILDLADVNHILTSKPEKLSNLIQESTFDVISLSDLGDLDINLKTRQISSEDNVYIIFTSGSTGFPKGAPINTGNIDAYFDSIKALNWKIDENDSFLQMSSLSFDFSILSFLLPICIGACVYSVPEDEIKFLYAVDLLDTFKITVAAVVPSTLVHLQQYFDELHFEEMKYCLVAGEAFPAKIAKEWEKCIPNAEIINIYGPTEATVFVASYTWRRNGYHLNKMYHDIVSVGKILKNVEAVVVDEKLDLVAPGQEGELLISGPQVTIGYLKNEERNNNAFVNDLKNFPGKRFYRTGDLVIRDEDGYILYIGRIDFQVKIQGHRIELGEIESHAREYTKLMNIVATTLPDASGSQELILIIENYKGSDVELFKYLNSKMPIYMIPSMIHSIPHFPLNANGKTDRNKLFELIKK